MNSSQGPGANGEGPSEWVERGVELAEEAARWAYRAGDHGDCARLWRRCAELSALRALRAHLEAKEQEHLATKALVEQLAEALEELHYSNTYKAERMALAALAVWRQYVATQEKT